MDCSRIISKEQQTFLDYYNNNKETIDSVIFDKLCEECVTVRYKCDMHGLDTKYPPQSILMDIINNLNKINNTNKNITLSMVKSMTDCGVDVFTNQPHYVIDTYLKKNKDKIDPEIVTIIKQIKKIIRNKYTYNFKMMHH
ncbi:MAG: hypothetical protein Terrestrivirus1_149 [Terrestrivirus sp.]|uniref:Uncharacterized protein n=1 Tax=Terrestrivirus sp. TaxID=2487775 RepID=A0A3G4ZKA6_9VIRU|nr:MAG: hypothetical protein Terrestrivirus1_149 [Terrestrivirus sp.]